MNPMQLAGDLQSVPDQQLYKYLQDPNSPAPQFLVMSEMQRRMELRQGQQAQQQAQPTVKDQMLQQAQPAQQGYAQGGIVGYAGGGGVDSGAYIPQYDEQGNLVGYRERGIGDSVAARYAASNNADAGTRGIVSNGLSSLFSGLGNAASSNYANSEAQRLMQSRTGAMQKYGNANARDILLSQNQVAPMANGPNVSTPTQQGATGSWGDPQQSVPIKTPPTGFNPNVPPTPPGGGITSLSMSSRGPASQGIAGVGPQAAPQASAPLLPPSSLQAPQFDAYKPMSQEEQLAARDRALAERKTYTGEDPTLGMKDRLNDREAKLDKDANSDRLLALLQGSLAIAAGNSPHALQNIAAGLGQGVAGVREVDKETRRAKEALEDKKMQYDLAAYRNKLEELGYGKAEVKDQMAQGKEIYQMARDNKQGDFNNQLGIRKTQQGDAQINIAKQNADTQERYRADQAAHNRAMEGIESSKVGIMERSRRDAIVDRDTQQRLAMISKQYPAEYDKAMAQAAAELKNSAKPHFWNDVTPETLQADIQKRADEILQTNMGRYTGYLTGANNGIMGIGGTMPSVQDRLKARGK